MEEPTYDLFSRKDEFKNVLITDLPEIPNETDTNINTDDLPEFNMIEKDRMIHIASEIAFKQRHFEPQLLSNESNEQGIL